MADLSTYQQKFSIIGDDAPNLSPGYAEAIYDDAGIWGGHYSLSDHLASGIDDRLDATPTGDVLSVFSTFEPESSGDSVYNSNLWGGAGTDLNKLGWLGVVWYSDYVNYLGNGIPITRRHILTPEHGRHSVGDNIRWILSDGTFVDREIIAARALVGWREGSNLDGRDTFRVSLLDDDLPATIPNTEFLNSVARTDTYALYNASMSTNLSAGISQSGASPNYSYSVIGSPYKPVTYVSWGDAARFSNWLHNNQPTGPQDSNTTERGAYTLDGAVTAAALHAVSRNPGAQWFIPTENEWYKAAYHQPASQGGDADDYWAYPTRSNSPLNSDEPPGDPSIQTNVANIYRYDGDLANGYNDGYAVTDSNNNHLTDVGSYVLSPSSYGTFDQAGNVWEWNEGALNRIFERGMRGGAFYTEGNDARSTGRYHLDPTLNIPGFRVACIAVPEPCTLLLAIAALAALSACRHRS